MTKRVFDIFLAALLLIVLAPLLALIYLLVRISSAGPAIYWSDRVGLKNQIFNMPKFRSMRVGTPELATHLLDDSCQYITPVGSFLRKTSLDELPQLFSVLWGKMSFVGPRPALFNQYDLIDQRTACNVHTLVPGITGWAQINGRDDLTIADKVKLDLEYLQLKSFTFDLKVIFMTAVRVFKRDGVSH